MIITLLYRPTYHFEQHGGRNELNSDVLFIVVLFTADIRHVEQIFMLTT